MKRFFRYLRSRGFTLVEALVVTIIAGYCILPVIGTMQGGMIQTERFDHNEKLRVLARSRLNKELAAGAFSHTAIDTTDAYHYVYYDDNTPPKLLMTDATDTPDIFYPYLGFATESILFAYKVSVAVKENLRLGTTTQNLPASLLHGLPGLKAVSVQADLLDGPNVIEPASVSYFAMLNIPSFSDDYIWIANAKNVEIIAVDPDSKAAVNNFLLPLINTAKKRDDSSNDPVRPWNMSVHPNKKFLIYQRKRSIAALNIDNNDSANYGQVRQLLPPTAGTYFAQDVTEGNKDEKDKALKDMGIVFRPDGKFVFITAHGNKRLYAYEVQNPDNWATLTLTNEAILTSFNTAPNDTHEYSSLHAGNDGYLYVGLKNLKKAFRYPMFPGSFADLAGNIGEEINDPVTSGHLMSIQTSPDGQTIYTLKAKDGGNPPYLAQHSSKTRAKTGAWRFAVEGDASDMKISRDGRYIGVVDEYEAKGKASNKGGLYVADMTVASLTPELNLSTFAQTMTRFKAARPAIGTGKKNRDRNDTVLFNHFTNEFFFDDREKPLLFGVDPEGVLAGIYETVIPEDRIVDFAPDNKSMVSMTSRVPQHIYVATGDGTTNTVKTVDIYTGKVLENKSIALPHIPVAMALSPLGDKFKVAYGNSRTGVDTFDTITLSNTQFQAGSANMFGVSIPNDGYHPTHPTTQTYFATIERHATNSGLNGYWFPDAPVPTGLPSGRCRDVNLTTDWVQQKMIPLNRGGFLFLFKKSDGSTMLDWIGRHEWGSNQGRYERFARWYAIAPITQILPATMPTSSNYLDTAGSTITIMKNANFPVGTRIERVKFNTTFSSSNGSQNANGRYITPLIVELSGTNITIRDIGNSIQVNSPIASYDSPVTWARGGVVSQANYHLAWWNGNSGTANNGVVKWGDNASGLFVSDYYPSTTSGLDLTVTNSAGTNRHYEIQFTGKLGDIPFPPLMATDIAISPDDRMLAFRVTSSPDEIRLYDFAGSLFGHETQLTGWVVDYRVGADPAWKFGLPATGCSFSIQNPTLTTGIKLKDSITSRDNWTGYNDFPGNFGDDASVSGANLPAKRLSNRRFFGYFMPENTIGRFAMHNRDYTRWFYNHSFVDERLITNPDGHLPNPLDANQPALIQRHIQIDYNTNGGEVKQGIFTHPTAGATLGSITAPGSAQAKTLSMDGGWSRITSSTTMPFYFQPQFMARYVLTGCNNDTAGAIVWSRDLGNPILYVMDTQQDHIWAIKPGRQATRINTGPNFNSVQKQLITSPDGARLIRGDRDSKQLHFFDITSPFDSFLAGGVANMPASGYMSQVATLTLSTSQPRAFASLPFNTIKSTPASGRFECVATLSEWISGLHTAVVASGGIYILGGTRSELGTSMADDGNNGAPSNKIYKFNPMIQYGSNIAAEVATLPRAIKQQSIAAYDNKIYVFNGNIHTGGGTNSTPTDWVQMYDPETGKVISSFDPLPVGLTDSYLANVKMTNYDKAYGQSTIIRAEHTGSTYSSQEGYKLFNFDSTHGQGWFSYHNGNSVTYSTNWAANKFIVDRLVFDNNADVANKTIRNFTFEGSNNGGGTWHHLHTGVDLTQQTGNVVVDFDNPTAYNSYRFTTTGNWGNSTSWGCRELKMMKRAVRRVSPLQSSPAPTVSGNTATFSDGTTVEWSSADDPAGRGWRAFDGVLSDSAKCRFNTTSGWLKIALATPDTVNIFRITGQYGSALPRNFKVYGSNGVMPAAFPSWDPLLDVIDNPEQQGWNTYHMSNTTQYQNYAIEILSAYGGGQPETWEIELYSTKPLGTTSEKPSMTKVMTDTGATVAVQEGAACTTPYGIVVAGGKTGAAASTATNTAVVYWPHALDSYTDSNNHSIGIFRSIPNMLGGRFGHCLVWHKGKLYRIGGRDHTNTVMTSVDIFDFDNNSWGAPPLTSASFFTGSTSELARFKAAACSFGDEIFVFGGEGKSNVVAWNPETTVVRVVATMPNTANYAKSAVAYGSAIYLIGGSVTSSTGAVRSIWKFTP